MASTYNFTHDKDIDYPDGYQAIGGHLGIKRKNKDTALLVSKKKMKVAGVFSQNNFRSVALDDAIAKIKKPIKMLAIFSGNANACTGVKGKEAVDTLSDVIVQSFARFNSLSLELETISADEVLVSFTGVIGIPFPVKKISDKIGTLIKSITTSKNEARNFYDAILTTDTRSKKIALETKIDGQTVRFAACSKGAGMIHPNMATMLSFITTDLDIDKKALDTLIKNCCDKTFNRISIDGDTSTNDSFFLMANGASGITYQAAKHKKIIAEILQEMALYLAKEIIRDGEGVTKFVIIHITSALSEARANLAARTVANSLLVKTALYGSDPNYGRILSALGSSGLNLKIGFITLGFGSQQEQVIIFKNNALQPKNLKKAIPYLKEQEIHIHIDLGEGKHSLDFYTSDISEEYVRFNGHYTT